MRRFHGKKSMLALSALTAREAILVSVHHPRSQRDKSGNQCMSTSLDSERDFTSHGGGSSFRRFPGDSRPLVT